MTERNWTMNSTVNMAMEINAILSESVVEQRQATLHEFSDVINAANKNLDGILKEIGWSIKDIQSKEPLATCPINSQHRMVESSLRGHVERCKWVQDGYSREEQEESASSEANSFFYENKKDVHAIELDADCQREIMSRFAGMSSRTFPRTMDRQDAEFSPDQRLAIYEKVMEKSEGQRRADQLDLELDLTFDPDKKDDEEKKEKSKTHAEVLAEMRDYRRRRQSYRAKNVHITKKSKTDVMRDIIDTHMKFLEDTLNSAKEEEEEEERKRERTHSRSREGSSLSSRDARDHHRRRRSRSRDRSSRRDEMSRSSSRSRDGKSHHHKHHRHHSKHKHKSRHRSPTVEEFE